MIYVFQAAIWAAFLAKLLWNASIPWVLWSRNRGASGDEKGISLMPLVELTLIPTLLVLAWLSPSTAWHGSVVHTAGVVLAALLAMTVLMVVSGALGKLQYGGDGAPPP